jgi:hypothetical protein
MSRRYNAQESKELIISSAEKLFLEKGFDKVSMRDISEEAKLSKGAIYHHYKSKDEIIKEIINKYVELQRSILVDLIKKTDGYTGKDKIVYLLDNIVDTVESRFKKLEVDEYQCIKSPDMVYMYLKNNMNYDAPMLADIIETGNKDGSLSVEKPLECAEIFLMLINIWMDPSVIPYPMERRFEKFKFLQSLMKNLGCDIITDEFIKKMLKYMK